MESSKIKMLTEIGILLAMAAILSFLKIFQMPQGGSVSLEMIPLIFISIRLGWKKGVLAGVTYGFLQLILGGFIVHWAQALLDYPLAFGVLGLAGLSAKRYKDKDLNKNLVLISISIFLAGILRLIFHVLSGVIFFSEYVTEGMNPWIYSIIYNASYIIPELIIAIVVMILLIKKIGNTPLNKSLIK